MSDTTVRVAVITGAGRGIGREHALELARQGVAVVVNDLGGGPDGAGADATPVRQVVAEIEAMGGRAIADDHDVSAWDGAQALVQTAVEHFGSLDILVNNAGILRDRTLAAMTIEEWDAGVTVNAVAPAAVTRLTEALMSQVSGDLGPEHIAKLVGWLASPAAHGVTGRVFDVFGSRIGVAEGWHLGPRVEKDGLGTLPELDEVIPALVAQAAPPAQMNGEPLAAPVTA